MGAIELQVFVGLVVILGAAFVALICDFLKGNNEQLRESNIELKVRHDERDKRDQLVQEVQRQTIEVVAQIQRVTGQRVSMPPAAKLETGKAEVLKVEPSQATLAPAVKDARTLFEQAEQSRQGRGRRDRRRMADTAEAQRPAAVEPQSPAEWAQEVYLRRFPQAESRRAAGEASAVPEPPAVAPPQPTEEVRVVPAETVLAAPAAVPPVELAASQELAPVALEPVRAAAPASEPDALELVESVDSEPAMPAAPAWVLQSPEEAVPEAAAEPQPVAEIEPEMAGGVGVTLPVVGMPGRALEACEPMAVASQTEMPSARRALPEAVPGEVGLVSQPQSPVPGAAVAAGAPAQPVVAETVALIPGSGLLPLASEAPVGADAEAEGAVEPAVPASNVVRIRVLREEEVVLETVPAEPEALVAAEEVLQIEVLPAEADLASEPEMPVEVAVEAAPFEPETPAVAAEAAPAGPEPVSLPEIAVEAVESVEPVEVAEVAAFEAPAPEMEAVEVAAAEEERPVFEPSNWEWEDAPPAVEPIWLDVPVETEAAAPTGEETSAGRSNVVEMPALAAARAQDAALKAEDLVVPGGYHEPHALARLMEEPGSFRGLAMVVSLVDYVRLLADQGKPAMEQLMGSVSRQVVSMTREQDFACRIGEDEFVLLFVKESGAAAKRRIQLVAERLWDFQLRSLGPMSVLFSWGASESSGEPLAQVVERAREQMIETRRNRRALGTGAGRFRRVAND